MKCGICLPLAKTEDAKRAGYDYYEAMCGELSALSGPAFSEYKALTRDLDFHPELCCKLLKKGMRVTGEDRNLPPILPYLEETLGRAAELGCRAVGYGSPFSRNLPEGYDTARAEDELGEFLRRAADIAQKAGILLLLEPVAEKNGCNFISTVEEGAAVVRKYAHPNLALLCDFQHMATVPEKMESILSNADILKHAHISNPVTRTPPTVSDGVDYSAFFDAIRQCGIPTVTIEANALDNCGGVTFDMAAEGLELLRRYTR